MPVTALVDDLSTIRGWSSCQHGAAMTLGGVVAFLALLSVIG